MSVFLKKKKILLITHEFTISGAPLSLLGITKILLEHNYEVECWSFKDGPMKEQFLEIGIPIGFVKRNTLFKESLSKLRDYDLVIGNTILTFAYMSACHENNFNHCLGRLKTDKWQDKNGNERYTTKINAQHVQFLDRKNDEQYSNEYSGNAAKINKFFPTSASEMDDIPFEKSEMDDFPF